MQKTTTVFKVAVFEIHDIHYSQSSKKFFFTQTAYKKTVQNNLKIPTKSDLLESKYFKH